MQTSVEHDGRSHSTSRGERAVWYDLGPALAIPRGEGRVFHVAGRDIAVFRTRAGELFATQPRCPHRGGPLADGIIGGGSVLCPLHAYRFDLASGAPQGNGLCAALTTYPVHLGPTGTIRLSASTGVPDDVPAEVCVGRAAS